MIDLESVQKAPEKPGVYIFLSGKKPIYIGKAINLRERLIQHIKLMDKNSKEHAIVSNSSSVEWFVTRNEYEALTLEVDLIQLHKPRYNVMHRHGSGYPLLLLTEDSFPTIKVVRGISHSGKLFGPFFNASKAWRVKKLIHKQFRLRTCDPMPERPEPCIDYHLGLCSGPCAGLISKQDYELSVRACSALLSGDVGEVLSQLYEKISIEMERLNYERCALYRDQIMSLENLGRAQSVAGLAIDDADIFYLSGKSLGVFLIRTRKLVDKEIFTIETKSDIEETLLGFYYNNPLPSVVFLNFEISKEAIEWLKNRGKFEFMNTLDSGLLKLIEENMRYSLDYQSTKEEFRSVLGIEAPNRIEGFDISHFYGDYTVGSCVVWEDGSMVKRLYRRYRIKTVNQVDDYASLREVLKRRARRLIETDEFLMPDIWLIDGGRGQLSVALEVKREFSLPLRVYSLAKAQEILISESGEEVPLREHQALYRVFGLIRDEAHRFALTYARALRDKDAMKDTLESIKGIGPARKELIYRNFKNLYELLSAEDEFLLRIGLKPEIKLAIKQALGVE
ncbi:MAG: excinuclease ABC subunit UvrC [Aquificaceae bacterium]